MGGKLCLTANELQEALGIGRSSVYELLRRKDFPTVRIGRRIVVPVDSLRAWLAQQSTGEGGATV